MDEIMPEMKQAFIYIVDEVVVSTIQLTIERQKKIQKSIINLLATTCVHMYSLVCCCEPRCDKLYN